jgi:HSP20 family molecular chaperone IbpA
MPFFHRIPYTAEPTFNDIFRLLNDVETCAPKTRVRRVARYAPVNPSFDIRETETTFELHGEVPGVDRKDITIEFTEPQTLAIRGRVERNYTAGTPPAAAAAVQDTEMTGAITEKEVENEKSETASHNATVSDEDEEWALENGEDAPAAAAPTETPATEKAAPAIEKPATQTKPKERYWHQERSVGEFHRTFTFNTRVDDSAVTANLANGILHVTVPKAVKHEARRINVE